MTDTDRLEQIRLLEAALNERNAELKRVRDQRDMLRVERDEARRDWCRLWAAGGPLAPTQAARVRQWDCFQGAR